MKSATATATELGETEARPAKAKGGDAHRPCIEIALRDFDASERCQEVSELRRKRCSACRRRYRCRCRCRRRPGSTTARSRTARSSPDCLSRDCRRLLGIGYTSFSVYMVCTSCSAGRGHISLDISWRCCSRLQSKTCLSLT